MATDKKDIGRHYVLDTKLDTVILELKGSLDTALDVVASNPNYVLIDQQERHERAHNQMRTQSISANDYVKKAGFNNINEAATLAEESYQNFINWAKKKPRRLELIIKGLLYEKGDTGIKNLSSSRQEHLKHLIDLQEDFITTLKSVLRDVR